MNAIDYLHMQIRLEGKSPVGSDRLKQVEVVADEDMPLMLIAHLADQQVAAYYDETLTSELRGELAKQIQGVMFPEIEPLLDVLKAEDISFEVGHYKTYIFPLRFEASSNSNAICLHNQDRKVQAFGFDGFSERVYAVEWEGRIVSACVSTGENEFCGEAWVNTDSGFRNQGNAQKVVGVWAKDLISAGKIPFYSHDIQNIPSVNLANRLGLQPVFEEIVFTYANV